jgi:hypothetical protein
VHLPVEVHETVISLEPIWSLSAPFIGRKPEPWMVTLVGRVLIPMSGVTRTILVVVNLVAVTPHTRAARPGRKLLS